MIASEADLPQIVELGREAHGGSAWNGLADFCPESFEKTCRGLMERDDALVLFDGQASLWMVRFPLYFNHAETVSNEVFFYARHNGDPLRRAAERWAEGFVTMSRNEGTDPRYDRLLSRAGYVPVEHTFVRRA